MPLVKLKLGLASGLKAGVGALDPNEKTPGAAEPEPA